MVTDALDDFADIHLDRIIASVIARRDWEHDRSDGTFINRAAIRLCAAADFGELGVA